MLGVAGGPLDKSWLLLVAYALRTAKIDLRSDTRQEFGAPPLLTERAKQGQIDAVLNFWPYAARLEADGFTQLIGVEEVVRELGARGEVAMVGFVFSETWAKDNTEAVEAFLRAAAILSRVRSLMISRSNWANESRIFSISRPMEVAVLNCWVTLTNDTLCCSNVSRIRAKSSSERLSRSSL